MDDKPTEVTLPLGINFLGLQETDMGIVAIGFELPGRVDLVLELTPEVLSKLEATLAKVREEQGARRTRQ